MERRSRLQPLARAVLRTQSDNRLVALARDGKDAAFEEIVRRYRPALVAFAAAYGPPDPEDVVQESLLRSWDALRESTGEMHLKSWLYTIVRNRALNARRDSRAHDELTEAIDGVPQPPEIALTNDELRRAVAAIIALPAAQREALVSSAIEGHSHDQIAATIGATPGGVRQLIYRARLTVRHGVGAVIPLPLVAALAELGAGGAGVAASGAAGGAAAGAAGGASVAAKTALVAAIGAVAIGSGAAIKNAGDSGKPKVEVEQAVAAPQQRDGSDSASDSPATPETTDDDSSTGSDPGSNRGEGSGGGSDEDRGGDDSNGGSDDGSGSSGEGPGPSGSGSGPGDDDGARGGGDSPNPGPGSGSSGPSGSSGSGDSGSGHSGPESGDADGGSSGPGGGDLTTTVPEPDSSGPGSGEVDGTTTTTTTLPEFDSSGPGSGELEAP